MPVTSPLKLPRYCSSIDSGTHMSTPSAGPNVTAIVALVEKLWSVRLDASSRPLARSISNRPVRAALVRRGDEPWLPLFDEYQCHDIGLTIPAGKAERRSSLIGPAQEAGGREWQVDRPLDARAGGIEVEARPFGDDPLRLLDAVCVRLVKEGQQPGFTIAYRSAVRDRDVSGTPPSRRPRLS